jgi:hypothetical protein
MTQLTVQDMSASGLSPSYTAADSGGDSFVWGRYAFVHVKNDDSGEHTVTITEQHDSAPAGYQEVDLSVAVPAGEERMIGPLDREAYQDPDGLVQMSYDAETSVTVAAIELPANR